MHEAKSKRNMFPLVILIVFAILASGFAVAQTIAFLTARQHIDNQLSLGDNVLSITETFYPPEELETGSNLYQKTVKFQNTGATESYIRAYVAFSDIEVENATVLSTDNGSTWKSFAELKNAPPSGWIFVPAANNAELGGYFYYTSPVAPRESTASLFTHVNTILAEDQKLTGYNIIVYSESVQIYDKDGELFTGSTPCLTAWSEFLSRKIV